MPAVLTPDEIAHMRTSGKITANILTALESEVRPGITTKYLDDIARKMTEEAGALPAFLGYQGFPAAICISVNDEIVHGIPSERVIAEGDLVGLDFGVAYRGMITDSAITVPVGKISSSAQNLLTGTQRALDDAVNMISDGVRTSEIGQTIEKAFRRHGLKVIHNLTGHGVGHKVHEDPIIPNHGFAGGGSVLHAGQTVAIEPIASLGTHEMFVDRDGWTCMTDDGSLSAQFEHTILITKSGSEVLTSR